MALRFLAVGCEICFERGLDTDTFFDVVSFGPVGVSVVVGTVNGCLHAGQETVFPASR